MEIVTAHKGEAHITAEKLAELNRGIIGEESFVFENGEKFRAEIISNNLIKIRDGCGLMQGREVYTPIGWVDEVTIENGSQGKKRIDLIVVRYEKNQDTKIETTTVLAIKGKESDSDPVIPDYVKGNIKAGDMKADWPLYEVELDGITVVEVRPVFKTILNMSMINKSLSEQSLKGKSVQTGHWGQQWKINQTDYYSIGGKSLLNQDTNLYATNESKITVKKQGTYLAILHAYTFSTSGGGTLWAKITVNSTEKQVGAARCQGYGGIDLHTILQLNANDVIDGLLSATGDITSEGKDTLTLIRL